MTTKNEQLGEVSQAMREQILRELQQIKTEDYGESRQRRLKCGGHARDCVGMAPGRNNNEINLKEEC
ncbi:MAG: hypothetical protein K8S55_04605 [Phycisphaerae bacterium]|nr:hypothetical protein [Phycisphaerae bacterium]